MATKFVFRAIPPMARLQGPTNFRILNFSVHGHSAGPPELTFIAYKYFSTHIAVCKNDFIISIILSLAEIWLRDIERDDKMRYSETGTQCRRWIFGFASLKKVMEGLAQISPAWSLSHQYMFRLPAIGKIQIFCPWRVGEFGQRVGYYAS